MDYYPLKFIYNLVLIKIQEHQKKSQIYLIWIIQVQQKDVKMQ